MPPTSTRTRAWDPSLGSACPRARGQRRARIPLGLDSQPHSRRQPPLWSEIAGRSCLPQVNIIFLLVQHLERPEPMSAISGCPGCPASSRPACPEHREAEGRSATNAAPAQPHPSLLLFTGLGRRMAEPTTANSCPARVSAHIPVGPSRLHLERQTRLEELGSGPGGFQKGSVRTSSCLPPAPSL
ncbi:uncharacterized protein [Muntiacus reevesi]|uniref:uncharacterized protein isoform X1 n=1 Tax=Muntiacus reevesi TaxID=9886 RepID=UPI0033079052